MKKLLVLSVVLLTGCTGYIKADAVAEPLEIVCSRHDAYVNADNSISEDKKRIWLRTTMLLRQIVAEAQK